MTERTTLPATRLDEHLVETVGHWFDSTRDYLDQLDRYKAWQGKP
jgi:hypothetical protein